MRKKRNPLPKTYLLLSRLAISFLLVIASITTCCLIPSVQATGVPINSIDELAYSLNALAMIFLFLLTVLCSRRGIITSGSLFLSNTFYCVFESMEFSATVRRFNYEKWTSLDVSYAVYYCLLLMQLLISCWADRMDVWDIPAKGKETNVREENPEKTVSFFNRITYTFFDPIAWRGWRRGVQKEDLWLLLPKDTVEELRQKWENLWNAKSQRFLNAQRHRQPSISYDNKKPSISLEAAVHKAKREAPSVFLTLVQCFKWQALAGLFIRTLSDILEFMKPLVLRKLIQFMEIKELTLSYGIFFSFMLLLIGVFQSLLLQTYHITTSRVGMNLKSILTSAIFEKALRLSNESRKQTTAGEMINMMSADIERVLHVCPYLLLVWSAPLEVILALVFLWGNLGPSVFAGLGVMVLMIPINFAISNLELKCQVQQMALKDTRMKMMNEVLNGIKALKLHAWEPAFEKKLADIRKQELHMLRKAAIYRSVITFAWIVTPPLIAVVSFATFLLSDPSNELTPEVTFVSLSLFHILHMPISLIPIVVAYAIHAYVSLKRLSTFLRLEELDESTVLRTEGSHSAISFEKATFSWEADSESSAILRNLNLKVPRGACIAVIGRGSNLSGGQKQRLSLARAVYQDANIYLLDDPLSAVDSHVGRHIFDHVIGKNGLLRKKTRIFVTNAVTYLKEVDIIVILEDGGIKTIGTPNELLKEEDALKQFLQEEINPDEENATEQGGKKSYEEISRVDARRLESQTSIISTKSLGAISRRSSGSTSEQYRKEKAAAEDKSAMLSEEETMETGRVAWRVYGIYMRSIGLCICLTVLLAYIITGGLTIASSDWLARWSEDALLSKNDSRYVNTSTRIGGYAGFGIGQAFFMFLGALVMAFGMVRASAKLHANLLHSLLRVPMSFYETTPLGRIVNRVGKDIDMVDNLLPNNIRGLMNTVTQVISTLVIIMINMSVFGVVVIPLAVLYVFLQRFYVATSRQLQRMEAVSRSPIYSLFQEVVQGISSVRAYNAQQWFRKRFDMLINENQMNYFPKIISNRLTKGTSCLPQVNGTLFRWLAVRIEFISTIMVFCAAIFAVCSRDSGIMSAGMIGLSITYALTITQVLNWVMEIASFVETNIVSVERIDEYIQLKHEDPVLFFGTIRMNIDPPEQKTDDEIWLALEQANLKPFVSNLPGKLDFEVSEGGENLSVGQRQMLCLARALLRRSRILVLDEATAAVDLETDQLIQDTIRRYFADCTVLTIAHRLNTILDSDRILVLSNGYLIENNSPENLLKDNESEFYSMARESNIV
ncbi:ABC transporter transmembrane region [Trichuris suis]|nr:ABC transporter transmembrane region [Trichuris suis]